MIASFIDKVIIYILGSIAILFSYFEEDSIAFLLIGLIMLGVSQCMYDTKHYIMELLVYSVFLIVAIYIPLVCFYLGICIYTIIYRYATPVIITPIANKIGDWYNAKLKAKKEAENPNVTA